MRTIKELLVLLKDALPDNKGKLFGYSFDEAIMEMYLEDKLERNEYHTLMGCVEGRCVKYNSKELAPRLEFLDKLIEELK